MNLHTVQDYFYPHRILDIGANVGQFHQLAKQFYPNSYIFSIEASAGCEQYLKQITDQYAITLLAKDTANYNFFTMKSNPINTGNSIYKELTEHYSAENTDVVTIKGTKLDDMYPSSEEFDLIKIDTQGSELDIISGGIELCRKAKGILLEVSLTQYNQNAPLYQEVLDFMENLGFKNAAILDENIHTTVHQQDILFINKNY